MLLLEDALSTESAAAKWLPRAARTNSSRKGPPNAMRAIELPSLKKVLIKAIKLGAVWDKREELQLMYVGSCLMINSCRAQ
jgi:hypothetical protein